MVRRSVGPRGRHMRPCPCLPLQSNDELPCKAKPKAVIPAELKHQKADSTRIKRPLSGIVVSDIGAGLFNSSLLKI